MKSAPQCPAQHRAQLADVSECVRLRVRQAVPIREPLELEHIRHRHVREMLQQHPLSRHLPVLREENNCEHRRDHPAQDGRPPLTFPPSLNRAPSPAARSTPRGLQLNLYPSGTPSAASGAGSPPQNDVKPTTRLPSARRRASSACAEQWSMPGSSPISFRRRTSAASALGAHGVGRGQLTGERREGERGRAECGARALRARCRMPSRDVFCARCTSLRLTGGRARGAS